MPDKILFYIDDSGARNPDHNQTTPAHGYDWFALGGVLINESDLDCAKAQILDFKQRWPDLQGPLHSHALRNRKGQFKWLNDGGNTFSRFCSDLDSLLTSLPVVALACVVDRPNYNLRYSAKYGDEKWMLCRSAFNIVVERAAKWAHQHSAKLNVYVEGSDRQTDGLMRDYFKQLKAHGAGFDQQNSEKYRPASVSELSETLYDFKIKTKQSELMQIADVMLWPMCIGQYDPANRAFKSLIGAGKLIDCQLAQDQITSMGIKWFCAKP